MPQDCCGGGGEHPLLGENSVAIVAIALAFRGYLVE